MQTREIAQANADDGVAAIVLDTPLLLEAGFDDACDAIVFVEASLETRRDRVKETRGWSADDLDRRQKHQMDPAAKRARSDFVIVNESTEADLAPRAKEILSNVLMRHQG
jgi:dephospho-CoA kinase